MSIALATAACRPPLTTCADDLRGVYVAAPVGAGGDERWMILDDGAALEAYPLFPDLIPGGPATEVAPRRIQLARAGGELAGKIHRRFLQRATACDATAPIHVTRCAGDTIELVAGDPAPPIGFAPCAWAAAAPSRAMRWRRE